MTSFRSTESGPAAFLHGGGEMGRRMRALDWSKTPIGPVEAWPQSLKTATRILLDSRYAMWMAWGSDLTFFCNDAYLPTVGEKQAWVLGASARDVWAEIWPDIGPRIDQVFRTGEATWDEGLLLFLERRGFPEETYHTFSYSPLYDDTGTVGGMLCVVTEDTERTIGERRLVALRTLASATNSSKTAEDACRQAVEALGAIAQDLPFVLTYLLTADGRYARLVAAAGTSSPRCAVPEVQLDAVDHDPTWPFAEVLGSNRVFTVADVMHRCGAVPATPWPEPVSSALVLPLTQPGQADRLSGFLVAAISPRRVFDEGYRDFVSLIANQVSNAIADARAFEAEKQRAESLAELDRAKMTFFSNVSHEFRTPLTLMLSPIEEMLGSPSHDPESTREMLTVVQRNGHRLLKLVNTLLDFSRIEAGRFRATFEPIDLATYTAELASVFRSAVEHAGLQLVIECDRLPVPIYIDRDSWERIVLNLISNAFKFTLAGGITVRLRFEAAHAVLSVEDTGTGIPETELPNLFDRFFRIEGAKGRTHEGTGIGLAMVLELAKLHGGSVEVESTLDVGSRFTVRIPAGTSHLATDQIGTRTDPAPSPVGLNPLVTEAMQWHADGQTAISAAADSPSRPTGGENRSVIVIAEDNTDMRDYLRRLLSTDHEVITAADGAEALAVVEKRAVDLVLTDVMMPNLDGFGLLKSIRANPLTAPIPIIILSARAGEEARVEGLDAGADDYLVKPFSARELMARVNGALALAEARRQAAETIRESESRARLALDVGRLGTWTWNPNTGEVTADARCRQICGFPPDGRLELDRDAVPRIHADDWNRVEATLRVTIDPLGSGDFYEEFRFVHEDGHCRWVIARGKTVFEAAQGRTFARLLIGTINDVTERKEAELGLLESESRFRTLAEASPALIWRLDPTGRVVYMNPRYLELIGRTPDQIQSVDWREFIHPDDIVANGAAVRKAQQERIRLRHRVRIADSERNWHWLESHALPLFLPSGDYAGHVGISIDITEAVAAEVALKDADRRKDEFLATLAHELRNPLAPIRNSLHIFRLSPNKETAERVHQMMERQVNHMIRLVDDLLEVSRITRGKIDLRTAPIDLETVISSAIETSRPLIETAGHQVSVALPHERVTLEADAMRLAQIFANLLNNAAKYTDRGGLITVTAREEGDEVVVSVKDNGIGIPVEMLSHVFGMFTQVNRSSERSQGGLGIGLTLVRSLVELHGGTVTASSEGIGSGSEFVVRLPTSGRRIEATPTDAPQADVFGPRRFLVVDDNRDAADSLGILLRSLGADVRVAHDGPSALTELEAFPATTVLLDVGMPGMTGYEVAERIRQQPRFKELTLIALTGWGQDEDRRRSAASGFDHHMIKPIDLTELRRLL